MNEPLTDAQERYLRATKDISKGLTFKNGGEGAEGRAVAAYKEMVREGTASPIKRKYLVGRHMKKVRS